MEKREIAYLKFELLSGLFLKNTGYTSSELYALCHSLFIEKDDSWKFFIDFILKASL